MNPIEKIIEVQVEKYFPTIKKILNRNAHHLSIFTQATKEQDTTQGFDAVYTSNDAKIAIRIREHKFAKQYMDITIRSKSKGGHPTEFDKMKQGYGDFYFYAWKSETGESLLGYVIFDIKKFVSSGLIDKPNGRNIDNGDGTMFDSYNLIEMMKAGIINIIEFL